VIWVAVGGRGTLIGAALGAVVVTMPRPFYLRSAGAYWLFMLARCSSCDAVVAEGNRRQLQQPVDAVEVATDPGEYIECCARPTASANPIWRSEPMNVMDTRATSALLYLDGVHVSFDGFSRHQQSGR